MRRKLKAFFVLGIFEVIVVFAMLFTLRRNPDFGKKLVDGDSKSVLGSWFWALNASISEMEGISQSLSRNIDSACIFKCEKVKETDRNRFAYFEREFEIEQESLVTWLKNSSIVAYCDSKLKIFGLMFSLMQNVTLHAYKWDVVNFARGGEDLSEFKGKYIRTDTNELLNPKKGLLTMSCTQHEYLDERSSDEVSLLKYVTFSKTTEDIDRLAEFDRRKSIVKPDYVSNFTIAIAREDYANIYHMTLHVYNIFLMLMAFKRQPLDVSVLLLDAHPKAEIDSIFVTLFGPLIRIGQLKRPIHFKNLVLSIAEGKSPLSKYKFDKLAYLEEFRSFVLNKHLINESSVIDCKKIKITIIWRRDKVYHPRNVGGTVERKIHNERELFTALYEEYPQYCVRGYLLETLPMVEQLKIIKNTDILIGMHGAGLIHTIYLPKTAGLIELFPFMFKQRHGYYKLFESVAKWRGLHYLSWENKNEKLEWNNYFTIVNVGEIMTLVENMVSLMCDSSHYVNISIY